MPRWRPVGFKFKRSHMKEVVIFEEVNTNMKDVSAVYVMSRSIFEAGTLEMLLHWWWSFPSGGFASRRARLECGSRLLPVGIRVQYLCVIHLLGVPQGRDTGDVRCTSPYIIHPLLGRQMWLMNIKFWYWSSSGWWRIVKHLLIHFYLILWSIRGLDHHPFTY